MAPENREAIERTVEQLIDDVGSWPGVTVGDHRFGGTQWRVGPREIGHVHAWGMLDIAYLRALRDALIEAGQTGAHHLLDHSGWTTFYIETPGRLRPRSVACPALVSLPRQRSQEDTCRG